MALFRTDIAKGTAPVLTPYSAGSVMIQRPVFAFTAAFTAASDKVEMACLPAGCVITRLLFWSKNDLGTNNVTVGLMSGTFTDDDDARTVGAELINASSGASDAVITVNPAVLNAVNADYTKHRGIGLKLSANVAAGNKLAGLLMEYTSV